MTGDEAKIDAAKVFAAKVAAAKVDRGRLATPTAVNLPITIALLLAAQRATLSQPLPLSG